LWSLEEALHQTMLMERYPLQSISKEQVEEIVESEAMEEVTVEASSKEMN